jgi:hypothetical protein
MLSDEDGNAELSAVLSAVQAVITDATMRGKDVFSLL